MCFGSKSSKPPPVTPEDPNLTAQKAAQFDENARKLKEEKDAETDNQRSRAYGFYGTRSLIASSGSGGYLAAAPK